MLELDDIQGPSVFGYKMPYGRFLFLRIDAAEPGRLWLQNIIATITTAQPWSQPPPFCVNVGFTYNGLKALGLAQASLDTFEEAFRQGVTQRSAILGDTGKSAPENWPGGLGSPELHAVVLIFAGSKDALEEADRQQRAFVAGAGGVSELSAQDATALPEHKEHFGYRDAISHVILEGTEKSKPGDSVVKPGEFILGYEDETGTVAPFPHPETLGRNGSFYAYRKLYQDVALWRRFLKENADDSGPEFLAAKLMGRWRSGAPLMLAPKADDPALATDEQRNGNFRYMKDDQGNEIDPKGLVCPRGAHIRRVNPRDDLESAAERKRHLLMRRGLPYGPPLPEAAADDGKDRGIAGVFVSASISRQFEFVQQVWIDNRKFHDLNNDKDPIAGDNDGTCDMTISAKPFARKIRGLPRFTVVKGGGYFFAPGLRALKFLAGGPGQ